MWELVKERRYPALATYVGRYDGVIVEFKTGPEQLPFMDQLGEWLADGIPSEAQKKGVTPLYLRVSRDIEPTFTTDWQVEFWGHESPIAPAALLAIIIGAAAVLVALISWAIVREITGYLGAQLELEEKKLDTGVALLEKGYSPTEVADFLEGIKSPPIDISPDLAGAIKDIATPAALALGGLGLVLIIALFAMSRK